MTKLTQSTEEYLEAIFKLQRGDAPVTVKRLAEELHVAPPSVSEMLGRLRTAGLVTPHAEGGIALTPVGEHEGAALVRRHRLSERFLVDYLDMPWDAVHDEACKLEHVLSPEVEARLAEQLGNPKTCPHGHAIPTEDGTLPDDVMRPLVEFGPGEHGVIGCIAEEDGELLRYLGSLGLLPETPVAVESVAPFGGPLLIRVAGSQYALGREVAGKILSARLTRMATVLTRRREKAGAVGDERLLVACLAGNPNVGKSSLFNALTGAGCETANCAGVTTEACAVCTHWGGRRVEVVDLPGAYSLDGQGGDQRAARAALLTRDPDVVVAVVDATNLGRSLYLPLQLLDLGFRVIVAVNLSDEARRRDRDVDAPALARELGVPVILTVAPRGEGLPRLEAEMLRVAASVNGLGRASGTPFPSRVAERVESLAAHISARAAETGRPPFGLTPRAAAITVLEGDAEVIEALGLEAAGVLTPDDDGLALAIAQARHAEARRLAVAAQPTPPRAAADTWWRLTTAPRTGVPILIGVIAAMFATLFVVGDALSRLLTGAWAAWVSPAVTSAVTGLLGDGVLGRTVVWGVDGGILATIAVGIPYILTFYFLLAFIEDTGYMNAAAFLSDRVMHRFGLHGRAVIPLIAAGGCNVPAIIATRSLPTKRERVIASALATLTPCSARTAVIIGAVAAFAGWQWALFTYFVVFVVGVSAGLGLNRLLPGQKGAFVMEMFPFRRPVIRQVAQKTWRRFREFVWDAAPIILIGSMALGALYETGLVWKLTAPLSPVVEGWLMLPAVAGLTLVFAVLRKELALQLLLVFAAVSAGGTVVGISSIMTRPQIITYAIVNTIYIPCLATIAVLRRELGWRWTAAISAGTIVLALAVGGVVARLLPLIGA